MVVFVLMETLDEVVPFDALGLYKGPHLWVEQREDFLNNVSQLDSSSDFDSDFHIVEFVSNLINNYLDQFKK